MIDNNQMVEEYMVFRKSPENRYGVVFKSRIGNKLHYSNDYLIETLFLEKMEYSDSGELVTKNKAEHSEFPIRGSFEYSNDAEYSDKVSQIKKLVKKIKTPKSITQKEFDELLNNEHLAENVKK